MSLVDVLESQRRPGHAHPTDDHERVCRLIEAVIAPAVAVRIDDLRVPSPRARPVAFARQSAMYLAHVVLGLNDSATGSVFRRDCTRGAHTRQVVEDRRDGPAVERLLQRLEGVCLALANEAQERRQEWS